MQDHVHTGETSSGHVHFLSFQCDVLTSLGGHLQQQGARAAGGVIRGGRGHCIGGGDAHDLGHDAADLGWRIELAFALAALRGKVPHQVLIGITQDVVVLGSVLREIQLGLLENANQIAQAIHHRLTFTELVRVIEVREVAACKARIGIDQWLNDLCIDLVANIALALEGDHVLEARSRRNSDWRGKVIRVTVLVGDVLDEQHEQDVVLILAGIHAAAELIARRPER